MAGTDQLHRLLLVLMAIATGRGEDELGAPISPEEFNKAMADPTLTAPPPEKYTYSIENSGEFQGDIKLTPKQQAQMNNGRSAIRSTIWENGILPYTISSTFTSSERLLIARVIAEYEERTCLRFVGRTTETDYIEIIADSGCWSYVGRIGGKQQLSLQQNGCVYFGITIHEFMHASGFLHEQSRYDRDDFVTINFENILDGRESNFEKQTTSTTTDLGLAYDYKSIMHYGEYAFTKNGEATITAKNDEEFGQRDGFSDLDVAGLNLLYNCEVPTQQTTSTPKIATTAEATSQQPQTECREQQQVCQKLRTNSNARRTCITPELLMATLPSGCGCCQNCKPRRSCRRKNGYCFTILDPVYNIKHCLSRGGTINRRACKGGGCFCCIPSTGGDARAEDASAVY